MKPSKGIIRHSFKHLLVEFVCKSSCLHSLRTSESKIQNEESYLTSFFAVDRSKKSSAALKNFLFKKTLTFSNLLGENELFSIAFALLICLGRQRSVVTYDQELKQLKLIGILHDKINDIIIQLTQFLRVNTSDSYTQYASLLPKGALRKMLLNYKYFPSQNFFSLLVFMLQSFP